MTFDELGEALVICRLPGLGNLERECLLANFNVMIRYECRRLIPNGMCAAEVTSARSHEYPIFNVHIRGPEHKQLRIPFFDVHSPNPRLIRVPKNQNRYADLLNCKIEATKHSVQCISTGEPGSPLVSTVEDRKVFTTHRHPHYMSSF